MNIDSLSLQIACVLLSAMVFFLLVSRPEFLFKVSWIYPFYSLLVIVLPLRTYISIINTLMQVIAVLASLVIYFRYHKKVSHTIKLTYLGSLSAFLMLGIYGVFLSKNRTLVIELLSLKFLLMPWLISVFAFVKAKHFQSLMNYIYVAIFLNAIACLFQSQQGTDYLLARGLVWGKQISYFEVGRVRLPGLTTTNFDLSLLAGCALLTVIIQRSLGKSTQVDHESNLKSSIVIISSVCCLYFSSTRMGILLAIVFFFTLMLFRQGDALKAFFTTLLGIVTIITAGSTLFIFNTSSLRARLELWSGLLARNEGGIFGNGISMISAANKSNFAEKEIRLNGDNQFIALFMNFGLFGILIIALVCFTALNKGNSYGKSIVITFIAVSNVTELMDYTNVFGYLLMLYLHFGTLKARERDSIT